MALTRPLLDVVLSGVSNQIVPVGLISEKLLPNIPVNQTTGRLAKYGTGHLRIIDSRVIGRARAPRVEITTRDVGTQYEMEEHALEGLVTAADYRNVVEPFK